MTAGGGVGDALCLIFYELNKSCINSGDHTQKSFHHDEPVTWKRIFLETFYLDTEKGWFTKITTVWKNVGKGWKV